jgi:hypothetical protein
MGVYIFQHAEVSIIKLGFTVYNNPWDRLVSFYSTGFGCTSYPPILDDIGQCVTQWRLLRWYPTIAKDIEIDIHKKYYHLSVRGEFYYKGMITKFDLCLQQFGEDNSSQYQYTHLQIREHLAAYVLTTLRYSNVKRYKNTKVKKQLTNKQ